MNAKHLRTALLVVAVGCNARSEPEMLSARGAAKDQVAMSPPPPMAAPAVAMPEEARDDKAGGANMLAADEAKPQAPGDAGAAPAAPARSWFPETFLFQPLVVTDENGAARLDVKVPDRLTTWRILALAHSRGGAQAGTVAQLTTTLPVYVEPVVPTFLVAGDVVRLPVQVVNTTEAPVSSRLTLTATGATVAGGSGAVTIAARSSTVVYATLTATRPGPVRLEAALAGADAVVRSLEVHPAGKPVEQLVSGTLAAPRTLALTGAAAATPGTDQVSLQVFPGALALLRSELGAAIDRGGVADDAFALMLAGRAPALLHSLGEEPDPVALRRLRILATQRVIRDAVSLDTTSATLLAEAALAHPDSPVLANIGTRAVQYLAQHQLPDGTCGGETGWTLQRLLVATADCVRAAHTVPAVVLRASGAVERNAEHIDDGYTAAALLASGAVSGALADTLREIVKKGLEKSPDGSQRLAVPSGVVRADGRAPSVVEATALAVLALEGDATASLADLGATVLGGYASGWGDGRANLVAMQAVLRLFKDPMPSSIKITLRMDDRVVAEGALGVEKVRSIVNLGAAGLDAAGAHTWKVEAEPAVPGLGYALRLTSWGAWPPPASGVMVEAAVPAGLRVGVPADLKLRLVAPAGHALHVRLALPAGVQADTAALDAMVSAGALVRYQASAGAVDLFAAQPPPSSVWTVRVVPTFAGAVQSGPSSLIIDDTEAVTPPARWVIGA